MVNLKKYLDVPSLSSTALNKACKVNFVGLNLSKAAKINLLCLSLGISTCGDNKKPYSFTPCLQNHGLTISWKSTAN